MPKRISFLLSLAALPACGPAVEDDPTVPDGGDPEKLDESCEDAFGRIYGCYGEEYTEAYSQEELDMYIGELCNEAGTEIAEYGDDCAGALEEVYACLASLGCDELTDSLDGDGDSGFPETCLAVVRDANQRCPEFIGFCQSTSTELGGNSCGQSSSGCLDGNTYAYACRGADAEQLACTCSANGGQEMAVVAPGQCGDETFGPSIAEACGFPEGVFR